MFRQSLHNILRSTPQRLFSPLQHAGGNSKQFSTNGELKKTYKTNLDHLRELWPLLRSAKRPQIQKLSDHIHTIVLPEELYLGWPFGDGVGNLLFVRPSQQATMDAIIERFKEKAINKCGRQFDHHGVILKGEPDIGKTTFLNLLMYHAAPLNVDVILHDATNMYIYLLRKDGTVDECSRVTDKEFQRVLFKPSTLYLFNADEASAQAYVSPAFTVIATTPDEKHYSNFSKFYGMYRQHLSPWTCDEAVDANSVLPPDQRLEESTIRERYEQVGGAIRFLFYPPQKYLEFGFETKRKTR